MPPKSTKTNASALKLGPRPATRDHLTSGKKPLRLKHQVVLDNELSDRLATARQAYELEEARFKAKPTDPERQASFEAAEAEYAEAQNAAAEVVFEVVLQGCGRHRYDLIKRAHPPTKQDISDAERVGIDPKQLEFSPQTFPPAIIAVSMIDPDTGQPMLTEEEVTAEIWNSDGWNEAEAQGLYLAAMRVNQSRATADLGKASGRTPG